MRFFLVTVFASIFAGSHSLAGDSRCANLGSTSHKIILFGEIHDQPIFEAELNRHKELARIGKEVFAEEGRFFSTVDQEKLKWGSADVGFDSPFPYGLNILLDLKMRYEKSLIAHDGAALDQWKFLIVNNTVRNPFLQEAWLRLKAKRPFSNRVEENFAKIMDGLLANSGDQNLWAKLKASTLGLDAVFQAVIKDFASTYVAMAKSTKYKKTMQVPSTIDLATDSLNGKNRDQRIMELAVKWRDVQLSSNILNLFCEAQALGKDLFVEVGALHVADLKRRINHLTHNQIKLEIQGMDLVSKLNTGLPIETPSSTKLR